MSRANRSKLCAYMVVGILLLQTTSESRGSEATTQPAAGKVAARGPLDFKVTSIDGRTVDLHDYQGKVVLIVNVASKCGFTNQYFGLEKLYKQDQDKGLVILAFPANNFKQQEPGTNEEIKAFVAKRYHVTFPMMAKISVVGDDEHPLYRYLTSKETGGAFAGPIEWNFTKLLIGRDGTVVARFKSNVTPQDPKLIAAVESALNAKPAAPAPEH